MSGLSSNVSCVIGPRASGIALNHIHGTSRALAQAYSVPIAGPLSPLAVDTLHAYLKATRSFLYCLQVAYVPEREKILGKLLRLPEE